MQRSKDRSEYIVVKGHKGCWKIAVMVQKGIDHSGYVAVTAQEGEDCRYSAVVSKECRRCWDHNLDHSQPTLSRTVVPGVSTRHTGVLLRASPTYLLICVLATVDVVLTIMIDRAVVRFMVAKSYTSSTSRCPELPDCPCPSMVSIFVEVCQVYTEQGATMLICKCYPFAKPWMRITSSYRHSREREVARRGR